MRKLTVGKVRALTLPGRYGDGGTLHLVVSPRVPAYRRVYTPAATAASVCSSRGSVAAAHWKLARGTSPAALRTRSRGNSICRPPSVTWLSTLPPRHAGRST